MKKDVRNIIIVIVSIVCILAFFVFAGVTKAIAVPDIPSSFLGAAAGAAITAVVTLLLLQGQTRAEEVKERNVAVFNEKTRIFKEFIKKIWEAWEDHKLESEEYLELTSIFYRELMLYLNDKSQQVIGNALLDMGDCLDRDIDENENKKEEEKLRKNIVVIIDELIENLSLGGKINKKLFEQLDKKIENARIERSQRTTFKMLGIKKGTELFYKNDPSITCITEDESNKVKFRDDIRSISNVAMELNKGKAANGFDFFMYNGKTLWEMRKKNEKN